MKDTKGDSHAAFHRNLPLPFGALMIGARPVDTQTIFDAVVVGGSFAGTSAAMQLVRGRRSVLIVDGGQPRNRFAAHSHGFPAQDGQPPRAIIAAARDQVLAYPTAHLAEAQATDAKQDGRHFVIGLDDGRTVRGRRVILATGVRDELPDIDGLQARWGASVFHCPYCHGYEVADQRLGVIANHPMSAHQAILIADWGPVTYFTQGLFEPDAGDLALMEARGVAIIRTPVTECVGQGVALEGVRLADGRLAALDALFTAPKTRMSSGLAEALGCAFDDGPMGPLIRTDAMKETTIAGVFAAGDAAAAMSNATLAAAAGVMAGVAAHRSLIFPSHA